MNQHKEELTQQIAQTKKAVEAGVPLPIKNTVIMFEGKLADARKYAEVFRVRCEAGEVELNMITPRLVELQTKIKGVKKIIQERENQQNPYREQIQTLRRKKSQLEAEQAQLETQLQKISRRIERHKFWIKGFKDVRLFIIEEILQELELATNAMLGEVGLLDWWVQYDIEKETKSGTTQRGINVVILSPSNKQAVRWETWSGGEGQRLRLISALALSEVLLSHAGVQTNLEMLDEPTSHLSTEGVQDLCEFLAQRARQTGKQIYYIDHTAVESTHFDRVLTVTKDKHGSTLSWEAT
jgi:DNA repair exonuclease SbcCD ATPase subunit